MKPLHHTLLGALIVGTLSLDTGCVASARVHGDAHIDAEPTLVSVGPGLWVVQDYDSSVFYSDGYYWRTGGGVWYRSRVHTGSWVIIQPNVVPSVVVRVDRPGRYARYHAPRGARVKKGPKAKQDARDHRNAPRSKPDARDHRKGAGKHGHKKH